MKIKTARFRAPTSLGTFKSLPTAEEMLERQLDKGRILANFTVERLASRISQQEGLEIDGSSEGSMIHDIKCELTHGQCKLSTKKKIYIYNMYNMYLYIYIRIV